jgi:Golgi phosphoprotein 3 (GPP34)
MARGPAAPITLARRFGGIVCAQHHGPDGGLPSRNSPTTAKSASTGADTVMAMDRIGEDLLLLCIGAKGRVNYSDRLPFVLMGSELVRLAAAGRADVQGDRVIVTSAAPTGDPRVDASLASLAAYTKPPLAGRWVGRPRRGIRDEYLAHLAATGAVRLDRGGLFHIARWYVVDSGRVEASRSRLIALAGSTGPVATADAAFAGLAHAVGVDGVVLPGPGNRPMRKRLAEIAKGSTMPRAVPDTAGRTAEAVDATVDVATRAAVQASVNAAVQASIEAAVQASVDAAVQASVAASMHATQHAHDAGGGHHGH